MAKVASSNPLGAMFPIVSAMNSSRSFGRLRLLGVALVLTALASACGSANGGKDETLPTYKVQISDQSIGVDDALRLKNSNGIVAVRGYLKSEAGRSASLCESFTDDDPPQCDGAEINIDVVQIKDFPAFKNKDTDFWVDDEIQLAGTLRGGVLTLSPGSPGAPLTAPAGVSTNDDS